MTETEIWTKWESQVINGLFPLRRFLGRSNHSVVFLTEFRAQNLPNAAIKIIPADPMLAETQLARWQAAAGLTHPHLLRILESGRCKLGGHPFLFVITEYAEQNLAQILPHRGLTADETREMLGPALDALAYLHGKNLVQGQLKPSNFLVVNDQLKLSSDAIRPAGAAAASVAKPSPYDAPESKHGSIALPGDIWSLGASLMEALTQIPPGPHEAEPRLPSTLPSEFAELLRRCLSHEPASRPTISELRAHLNATLEEPTPVIEAAPIVAAAAPVEHPQPVAPPQPVDVYRPGAKDPPRRPATASNPAGRNRVVPAAAIGFVILLALWAGIRAFRSHPAPQAPVAVQSTAPQASTPSAPLPAPAAAPAAAVLHQELPAVSRSARDSIHGQIKVAVGVTADRAGNVIAANLETHGSSIYFARLATDAARKWRFAPADNQSPRDWLLQFEFSRSGVTAHARLR
jgi:Protein kinase domain